MRLFGVKPDEYPEKALRTDGSEWDLIIFEDTVPVELPRSAVLLIGPPKTSDLGEVTGIIDWSDAAICDRAHDFGLLLRDLGPGALDATLASYGTKIDIERAWFYARCAAIEDLNYGVETGRDAYRTKTLDALSWLFAS